MVVGRQRHFVVWLYNDAGKMREMSEVGRQSRVAVCLYRREKGRQNCFALCLCDEERYERTLNALRCLAEIRDGRQIRFAVWLDNVMGRAISSKFALFLQ